MPLSDESKQGIRDQADSIDELIQKSAGALARKEEELETLQAAVSILKSESTEKKATVNILCELTGDEPRYEIEAPKPKSKGKHRTVFKKCDFCKETMECATRQQTCLKCDEKNALVKVESLVQLPAPKLTNPPPPMNPPKSSIPPVKSVPTTRRSDNEDLLSDFTQSGTGKVKKGCQGCGKVVYVMPSVTICPHCPDGNEKARLVAAN